MGSTDAEAISSRLAAVNVEMKRMKEAAAGQADEGAA
jgi:hypothetical protein